MLLPYSSRFQLTASRLIASRSSCRVSAVMTSACPMRWAVHAWSLDSMAYLPCHIFRSAASNGSSLIAERRRAWLVA